MIGTGQKEFINSPLNIDNYYGSHQGRLAPLITFLLVAATPFVCYTMFLQGLVPLWVALVFEVLWTIRMALKILGDEKNKLKQYLIEKNDEYASIAKMLRTAHVHKDGLIEYVNGRVAYILSGFTHTYYNDDAFSADFADIFAQLEKFDYDVICQQVVGEDHLQKNLEGLHKYTDKELMKERMEFLIDQDEYNDNYSKLYRISIVCKAGKYDWKVLKSKLDEIIDSNVSNVFFKKYICNQEQVSDIMSRDICAYVDLQEILEDKYKNDDYLGSEVLFYGNEIPEEMKPRKDYVALNKRRKME